MVTVHYRMAKTLTTLQLPQLAALPELEGTKDHLCRDKKVSEVNLLKIIKLQDILVMMICISRKNNQTLNNELDYVNLTYLIK